MDREEEKREVQAVESMLEQAGSAWRRNTRVSEDFVSRFEVRLSRSASSLDVIDVGSLRNRRRRVATWSLAAAAALAVMVGAGALLMPRSVGRVEFLDSDPIAKLTADQSLYRDSTLQTMSTGTSVASLDDDRIVVLLNSETSVRVGGKDEIFLDRGEVWVSVVPNSGRFEVHMPDATVTVHGTSFGVRVGPDESRVLLATGKISLEFEGQTQYLLPGTQAVLGRDGSAPLMSQATGGLVPAWAWDTYGKMEAARTTRYFPSALGGAQGSR